MSRFARSSVRLAAIPLAPINMINHLYDYVCADLICVQAEDEYMISDYDLMLNRYVSVPKVRQ